jgi:exodeoxyribonuclease VII large subunit
MMDMPPDISRAPVLSVSELNQCVRRLLEGQLPLTWVAGEISSLTRAASGHLYFILKDANAQVRCAIWRNKAQLLGFRPENGQNVEARVLATLYEARGDYQLNVETLRLSGQGRLFERFLELKARLEREGLFQPELKRPIPAFPRHLALVTSPGAAALRDVLATLARRAPHVALTLFPTPVQGEGAGFQIAQALAAASNSACDAILLCRGGGSMEDLWAFNEEAVARAIRASSLPVICGVGHETDFTIADFAADLRAPTPTSAAEQVCPDRRTLLTRLDHLRQCLNHHQENRLRQWEQHLDNLAIRLPSPVRQLALRRDCLTELAERLRRVWGHQQQNWQGRLEGAAQGLRQLNPHAVLARGYALVFNAAGHIVRDAGELRPDEVLQAQFAQGRTTVQVTRFGGQRTED